MITRMGALVFASALLLPLLPPPAVAGTSGAVFRAVDCGGSRETDLDLAVGLDAEITLDPGEQIVDGIHADPAAWDPHAIYDYESRDGQHIATPHLTFKPSLAGLEANVIVTTTRRTYRFYLRSVNGTQRTYVTCRYTDGHQFAPLPTSAPATPVAIPSAAPTAPPTLDQLCIDNDYPVKKMKRIGDAPFVPVRVCNDGAHMYVQLYSMPADAPALWIVGAAGDDQMANFAFDVKTLRYKLDGVFPTIALVLGTGKGAQRLVISHG